VASRGEHAKGIIMGQIECVHMRSVQDDELA
jgi:hypothetical protein